jgi:hypothetical protein
MRSESFGAEKLTEADRAYDGSRFSEVRDAIFANPYQRVWGRVGEPPLPTYEVTLRNVLHGILPPGSVSSVSEQQGRSGEWEVFSVELVSF